MATVTFMDSWLCRTHFICHLLINSAILQKYLSELTVFQHKNNIQTFKCTNRERERYT